jgi:hypothetical protein
MVDPLRTAAVLLVGCPALPLPAGAYPAIQVLVDAAPPGTVLTPPPGIYAGPLTPDKPLTPSMGGAGDPGRRR